jgi:hypothetical protein
VSFGGRGLTIAVSSVGMPNATDRNALMPIMKPMAGSTYLVPISMYPPTLGAKHDLGSAGPHATHISPRQVIIVPTPVPTSV